jgi:hypothetical protein
MKAQPQAEDAPMKARAHKGRLVMDEPTDLPDGTEVHVEISEGWDMDPAELAELQKALDESEEDVKAGRVVSAEDFLAGLGKRR